MIKVLKQFSQFFAKKSTKSL